MALPSLDTLFDLGIAYNGEPFVGGAITSIPNLFVLETVLDAEPFLANNSATQIEEIEEEMEVDDDVQQTVTLTFEEEVELEDTVTHRDVSVEEDEEVEIEDTLETLVTLAFDEEVEIEESIEISALVAFEEEVELEDTVEQIIDFAIPYSTVVEIATNFSTQYSNQVSVLVYDPNPVNILTSLSNPLVPTVICNGDTVVSNPETTPAGTVTAGGSYISIDPGLCDLISFNINLTYAGGTFSIVSTAPHTGSITLFGLPGIIEESGQIVSQGVAGYSAKGVFGSIAMNKQLLLITRYPQMSFMSSLAPSQTLQTPPVRSWSTVRAAAEAISNSASMDMIWATKDAPLNDLFPQSGMTALQALQALASKVGGIVCWDGSNGFYVVDPINGFGGWSVGDCRLILSVESLQIRNLFEVALLEVPNITSGTVELGAMVPFNFAPQSFAPPGTTQSAFNTPLNDEAVGNLDKVEPLGGISGRKLLSTDPAKYFPLPADADKIYIQIITVSDVTGTYATLSPSSWFELDPTHVETMADKTRRIVITSNDFPTSNTDINAGRFTLNVGYKRDINSLLNSLVKKHNEDTASGVSVLAEQQEHTRLVKVATGSATCVFHGHIPLPGNLATIVGPGGVTLQGIIESVSLSAPGILSLQVSQYRQLNFYVPKGTMDTTTVL